MQLDERVGVDPVSARGRSPVDKRHMDIGVLNECISERHAHCACTYDQVVGLDEVPHWMSLAAMEPSGQLLSEQHRARVALGSCNRRNLADFTWSCGAVYGGNEGRELVPQCHELFDRHAQAFDHRAWNCKRLVPKFSALHGWRQCE